MNKSAIQKYAIWARTEMIAQVEQRAYQYGITKDGYGEENAMVVQGRALSNQEQEQRWELIQQIKHKGFAQVMEEVAYTWFNRFIALRFMEVNNYLPTHIRVFSDSTGAFKPEILSNAMQIDLDGLDRAKVAEMIDANQTEELYRYLLVTQCNALNEALPKMFEKMGGYTELLLPNNILRPDGILGHMVSDIPEEDWNINALDEQGNPQGQVQIIGWLYQYYNSDLFNDIFNSEQKKSSLCAEQIPAATQLFTPDWSVRYMVENSLGRLWIEGHPNDALKSGWKYYLDEAEQEADVQAHLEKIRAEYAGLKPQDIKVIDPCMGSGHILVYAFDVLVQIYKSYGISERDAAKLILENNLYGLDIDDRAAQLAYFAVMMKARQYDRRIFSRGVEPHIYAIQESNNINRRHLKFFGWQMSDLERNLALNQLRTVLDQFHDAKEYGSILNISKQDWNLLYRFVGSVDYSGQMTLEALGLEDTKNKLFELIKNAAAMAQEYDIIVTNPPYLNSARMNEKLTRFVIDNYEEGKADFSTVMYLAMQRNYLKQNGFISFITTNSWMFLKSFVKVREESLSSLTFENIVDYGTELFDGKVGHLPIIAWCARKTQLNKIIRAIRLVDYCYGRRAEKYSEFFNPQNTYYINQQAFYAIDGAPIVYWISDVSLQNFISAPKVIDYARPRVGQNTGDNDRFLRQWYEISINRIGFRIKHDDLAKMPFKWIPYNKGGNFRRWYGNFDYVVNWENDGQEIKEYAVIRNKGKHWSRYIQNIENLCNPGVSWSDIATTRFGCRLLPEGFICDVKGSSMFPSEDLRYYLLAYLNSKLAIMYLQMLNPTTTFQVGNISALPLVVKHRELVTELANANIHLSQKDWDSFETSWDFLVHPLVKYASFSMQEMSEDRKHHIVDMNFISEAFTNWSNDCYIRFHQLKANEEELNRLFIDIYGLQNELTPEVEDKDVTVRKADLGRDIRSLISYAVGCMFGRYSLNVDGLAYAGGEWDASKYSSFMPDSDNIIPICDDDYFDDDIVARFVKWVETVYGKDTLEENLKFIANALGGKGTPREVIRNYFLNDFYADHLKIYQKRPIYWLFDSGKKNGFKALIYMHRYQSDLLARMRTDYVHEMQERYRTQLSHLTEAVSHASASERVKLNKQLKKIQDQALELQKYEEKIHHLADQNISIDLDDGVKHNYALFADVLAKIK